RLEDALALPDRLQALRGDARVVLEREADHHLERQALDLLVARDQRRHLHGRALGNAGAPLSREDRAAPRRLGSGGRRLARARRRYDRRQREREEPTRRRHGLPLTDNARRVNEGGELDNGASASAPRKTCSSSPPPAPGPWRARSPTSSRPATRWWW